MIRKTTKKLLLLVWFSLLHSSALFAIIAISEDVLNSSEQFQIAWVFPLCFLNPFICPSALFFARIKIRNGRIIIGIYLPFSIPHGYHFILSIYLEKYPCLFRLLKTALLQIDMIFSLSLIQSVNLYSIPSLQTTKFPFYLAIITFHFNSYHLKQNNSSNNISSLCRCLCQFCPIFPLKSVNSKFKKNSLCLKTTKTRTIISMYTIHPDIFLFMASSVNSLAHFNFLLCLPFLSHLNRITKDVTRITNTF